MRENRLSSLGGGRRSNPFSIHIYMDCGGKRSATPLWLRAESVLKPVATMATAEAHESRVLPIPSVKTWDWLQ